MFNEYIKDISNVCNDDSTTTTTEHTSTPNNTRLHNSLANTIVSPVKAQTDNNSTTSHYQSLELSNNSTFESENTGYISLKSYTAESKNPFEQCLDEETKQAEREEVYDILSTIYPSTNSQNKEEDCE